MDPVYLNITSYHSDLLCLLFLLLKTIAITLGPPRWYNSRGNFNFPLSNKITNLWFKGLGYGHLLRIHYSIYLLHEIKVQFYQRQNPFGFYTSYRNSDLAFSKLYLVDVGGYIAHTNINTCITCTDISTNTQFPYQLFHGEICERNDELIKTQQLYYINLHIIDRPILYNKDVICKWSLRCEA